MKIVYDYPPNYDQITKVFKIADNENVIFTYGDTLYVPRGEGTHLDKPLIKHEETHARQQKVMGVDAWWERFLEDNIFRMSQEIEAYRNQYAAMGDLPLQERQAYVTHIAKDLSGEIYGNLMTFEEAVKVICQDIKFKKRLFGRSSLAARKAKKAARQNRKKGRK